MADPYRESARRLRELEDSAREPARRRQGFERRTVIALAALGLLGVGALIAGVLMTSSADEERPPADSQDNVTLRLGEKTLASRRVDELGAPSARQELVAKLPKRQRERERDSRARRTLEIDRDATLKRLDRALERDELVVSVAATPVAARHRLPIVKQVYRNNCETAALSMLLAAEGIKADQADLQRRLPASGPLDPEPDGAGFVWGDPDAGFVGRVDGGGTSGGYGVYEPPIAELAREAGASPELLTGTKPSAIYDRLLEGRPVMVWVGLSDGPFETWKTPEGAEVTGNFGEHTVVLTGLDGDSISVNDPLQGVRTTWTRAQFGTMWERLGRRALTL